MSGLRVHKNPALQRRRSGFVRVRATALADTGLVESMQNRAYGHLEKFIHTEARPSVFKGLVTAGNNFRGIFRGALITDWSTTFEVLRRHPRQGRNPRL